MRKVTPVAGNPFRKTMDFEFLAYVSWRGVLLAVVVLLVLYILLSFLRMSRLKNATMRNNYLPSREARHAVAA